MALPSLLSQPHSSLPLSFDLFLILLILFSFSLSHLLLPPYPLCPQTAINYALKIGDYEYAHDVIARQNIIYRKRLDMFEQDIYKNFLAQIILYLGTGKLREARNALTAQELAPDAANYGRSDPYAAAVVRTIRCE